VSSSFEKRKRRLSVEELTKRERPVSLPGVTIRKVTGCGNLYVIVTHIEGEDKPLEVLLS